MDQVSDEALVRYLLGDLPDDEAERLDQRSVTDGAFALRLRVVEDDLVDRYVRGGPFDPSLEQFDRLYRHSPHLRDKVQFAEALQVLSSREPARSPDVRAGRRSTRLVVWSLAMAAGVLMAVAGYLLAANIRLRDGIDRIESRRAAIEARTAALEQELGKARQANVPPVSPIVATFSLPPPRRGLGSDATEVAVPKGAQEVVLRLQLDANGYATYWTALRNLETGAIDWRTSDVTSEAGGGGGARFVAAHIPATALRPQRYAVELSGVSRDGSVELVGTYLINAVLE